MLTFNTFKTALNAISLQFDALKKSFDGIVERLSSTEATIPTPDWDENDPESKNYVKNRTHYEYLSNDTTTRTVMTELEDNGLYYGATYYWLNGYLQNYYGIVRVIYDGTQYAIDFNPESEASERILGDKMCVSYPFGIDLSNEHNYIYCKTPGTHTFEVTKFETKKLDVKFIPDEVHTSPYAPVRKGSAVGSTIQGFGTIASNSSSHAEGYYTTASGPYSHAEGNNATASGDSSHAEGHSTYASGASSHAEGCGTEASGRYQHVQGKYNVADITGKYAHIVGNGTLDGTRSNAHTLDWEGNAWFAGTVEGTKLILKSATSGSKKRFEITVDDSGAISAKEITS